MSVWRTLVVISVLASSWAMAERAFAPEDLGLSNVVPPLVDGDDPRSTFRREPGSLPIPVAPHVEHVRGAVPAAWSSGEVSSVASVDAGVAVRRGTDGAVLGLDGSVAALPAVGEGPAWAAPRLWAHPELGRVAASFKQPPYCNGIATLGSVLYVATDDGLFSAGGDAKLVRHPDYGVNGPLATRVTSLVVLDDALWIGTPLGISIRHADGTFTALRGAQGLPYEDVTSLHLQDADRLWIGTSRGLILHMPNAPGRKWFYRAGQRYLPDDFVTDIVTTPDGGSVFVGTKNGVGRIDLVTTTLGEKARVIEERVNARHRRFGLVASCILDDPFNPTSHTIEDNDNDGLWTAYHVGAMSLAYSVTRDAAAKASARESMHALYMLQDASGTPGLVARSVVPPELGRTKNAQWRPTPDGLMYWKSDTSSDEIDGHYFAFYMYWEHIAKDDSEERGRVIQQVRELTDYLVDNDYLLLDWDGKHTRWGFWKPEMLNEDPTHYLENGLNSLQMLSFLKVAHYITGDAKYARHYRKLIRKHGYLNNVLLEKKVFPDENNHSDNQLGYVAYYPILQLERDPLVREALHKAVRRHYKTLADHKSSFFYFATATIDPDYVDLEGAIENLQDIPTDRRTWQVKNSIRTDVIFDPRVDRFGEAQTLHVLPADERNFEKWNQNLYRPDDGGDGRYEDDGSAYLLPYWMGRYHGFFQETP